MRCKPSSKTSLLMLFSGISLYVGLSDRLTDWRTNRWTIVDFFSNKSGEKKWEEDLEEVEQEEEEEMEEEEKEDLAPEEMAVEKW